MILGAGLYSLLKSKDDAAYLGPAKRSTAPDESEQAKNRPPLFPEQQKPGFRRSRGIIPAFALAVFQIFCPPVFQRGPPKLLFEHGCKFPLIGVADLL